LTPAIAGELRQAIRRLSKKLVKEERRAKKVKELKETIRIIAAQVEGYRNDPELR